MEREAAVIDWKLGEPRKAQAALEEIVERYRSQYGNDSDISLSAMADSNSEIAVTTVALAASDLAVISEVAGPILEGLRTGVDGRLVAV